MINTSRVIFIEQTTARVAVTAATIGAQLSGDYADAQAAMLVAWADDVQACHETGSWVMQCRHIVDEMTARECAHVAAMLEPLVEHLKEQSCPEPN